MLSIVLSYQNLLLHCCERLLSDNNVTPFQPKSTNTNPTRWGHSDASFLRNLEHGHGKDLFIKCVSFFYQKEIQR